MFRRLRLISAALCFVRTYIRDDPVFNHMRVLSPDACGATRAYIDNRPAKQCPMIIDNPLCVEIWLVNSQSLVVLSVY